VNQVVDYLALDFRRHGFDLSEVILIKHALFNQPRYLSLVESPGLDSWNSGFHDELAFTVDAPIRGICHERDATLSTHLSTSRRNPGPRLATPDHR
jgi:hypothetical protein